MSTLVKTAASERAHLDRGETDACPCGHSEVRCDCGSLLAKLVRGAVELKCRRCKRTWRIPIERR
jgi:hypothetical protein